MEVTIEDQWGKTKALCPNDAGIPPDLVANDGIYTADFQDVGVYLIKSKIHNRNGKACTTTLTKRDYFKLPKNLEGPSPVFGEPIQENFERTVYVPLESAIILSSGYSNSINLLFKWVIDYFKPLIYNLFLAI